MGCVEEGGRRLRPDRPQPGLCNAGKCSPRTEIPDRPLLYRRVAARHAGTARSGRYAAVSAASREAAPKPRPTRRDHGELLNDTLAAPSNNNRAVEPICGTTARFFFALLYLSLPCLTAGSARKTPPTLPPSCASPHAPAAPHCRCFPPGPSRRCHKIGRAHV